MDQCVVAFEGAIRERDDALGLIAPGKSGVAWRTKSILDDGFINWHSDKHGGIPASKSGRHCALNSRSACRHDQEQFQDPATTTPMRLNSPIRFVLPEADPPCPALV
jgi:hypothetical protein